MTIIPYLTYILFIVGIIIYIFTLLLINGQLFALYSDNDYPYDEYIKFWKNMTSEQRLFVSKTYYQFFINFNTKLDEIEKTMKNKNLDFEK